MKVDSDTSNKMANMGFLCAIFIVLLHSGCGGIFSWQRDTFLPDISVKWDGGRGKSASAYDHCWFRCGFGVHALSWWNSFYNGEYVSLVMTIMANNSRFFIDY